MLELEIIEMPLLIHTNSISCIHEFDKAKTIIAWLGLLGVAIWYVYLRMTGKIQ